MLVARLDRRRMAAKDADKGPSYACPHCGRDVILKKGQIVVHHFAHKPPVDCDWARGETLAHLAAKDALCEAWRARGLRAEVEHEVPSLAGDRRADVMVRLSEDHPVAFELQHHSLGLDQIERRTRGYAAARIPVVWIPFLRPELRAQARRGAGGDVGDVVIERYAARPWERWLYTYAFGEIWYYAPARRQLWRGRLRPHLIQVPDVSFHDDTGEELIGGSYERSSKRWRTLLLWGPYELGDVRVKLDRRTKDAFGPYHFPIGPTATLQPT